MASDRHIEALRRYNVGPDWTRAEALDLVQAIDALLDTMRDALDLLESGRTHDAEALLRSTVDIGGQGVGSGAATRKGAEGTETAPFTPDPAKKHRRGRLMLRALLETYLRESGFHYTDESMDRWGHRSLGEGRSFSDCVLYVIGCERAGRDLAVEAADNGGQP